MTALPWNELTSGLQFGYLARADYLIQRGYRHDVTVEQLAEEMYNKERHKIEERVSRYVAGLIQ